jgi:hypothetical protein
MQLLKAERKQALIKLAIQGPSGSGKTYSSLLLAHGLAGNWNQIVERTIPLIFIHIWAHSMY